MKAYILFITLFLTSCMNKNNKQFEKVLTNENNIWIFYEGNYDHFKNVSFDAKYKFFKDGSYEDIVSPKPFGRGNWTIKNNMIQINADSYDIISYTNDSIVLENRKGLQARFYNIKSSVAEAMIQYKFREKPDSKDLHSVPADKKTNF